MRLLGLTDGDITEMLNEIGIDSIDELIEKTIPESIRSTSKLGIGDGLDEFSYLQKTKDIANKNKVYRNYIGTGYYGTVTPSVIQRNILENPGWYTAYTPYQAEIAQGRLEALLNFQTMIADMTCLLYTSPSPRD